MRQVPYLTAALETKRIAAQEALGPENHHQDQNDTKGNTAQFDPGDGDVAQEDFIQKGENDGAHNGAPIGAHTADKDKDDELDGDKDIERSPAPWNG